MTEEDKKRISEYMRWTYEPDRHCIVSEGENHRRIAHNLDLNDAGLCIAEIQKRGDDYVKFIAFAYDMAFDYGYAQYHTVTAWLFNAENFFAAMAAYLKEGKK